jgi:hypothetical protein
MIDVAALSQAQAVLATLYSAAANNAGGVIRVVVDGQDVTYSTPGQLNSAIMFWEKKVALLSGRRRRVSTIRLDRF